MNEGIHLDLDTWIVAGQIRKANLCRGLGNRYTPAGTEVFYGYIRLYIITDYAQCFNRARTGQDIKGRAGQDISCPWVGRSLG